MNTSTLLSQLQQQAPNLLSPSSTLRNSTLNQFTTPDVVLSSPWCKVKGASQVKGALQVLGTTRLSPGEVEQVEWDEGTRTAKIISSQVFTLPLIQIFRVKAVQTTTTLHLTPSSEHSSSAKEQSDDEGKPTLWLIDEISDSSFGSRNFPFQSILSLVLPFVGQLLLHTLYLHTYLQKQASGLQHLYTPLLPGLFSLIIHPIKSAQVIGAAIILFWVRLAGSFVGLWQNHVAKRIEFTLYLGKDTMASNLSKKKALNASRKPDPTYLQANPTPGESYAAVASPDTDATNTDTNGFPANGHSVDPDRTIPELEAAKPENLLSNPTPGESYASAVKIGPSEPVVAEGPASEGLGKVVSSLSELDSEEEGDQHAENDSKHDGALVEEGFSYADAVKE